MVYQKVSLRGSLAVDPIVNRVYVLAPPQTSARESQHIYYKTVRKASRKKFARRSKQPLGPFPQPLMETESETKKHCQNGPENLFPNLTQQHYCSITRLSAKSFNYPQITLLPLKPT